MARFRLPRPSRPPPVRVGPVRGGEIVLVIPAHNEAGRLGALIERLPALTYGRVTRCLVVDDGSTDDTVLEALGAGAKVVAHDENRGLGAAVRTGIQVALADGAEVIAFCDGDGEYRPEELESLVRPILDGHADYVVGSRFAGTIRRMPRARRIGNVVLTGWVRWMTRQPVSDGQSGFRALSRVAAARADVIHDYNYAQVLTLNLLGQGFRYAEVPISYEFRASGRSFVRPVPYLWRVIPASIREIRRQSSTT